MRSHNTAEQFLAFSLITNVLISSMLVCFRKLLGPSLFTTENRMSLAKYTDVVHVTVPRLHSPSGFHHCHTWCETQTKKVFTAYSSVPDFHYLQLKIPFLSEQRSRCVDKIPPLDKREMLILLSFGTFIYAHELMTRSDTSTYQGKGGSAYLL